MTIGQSKSKALSGVVTIETVDEFKHRGETLFREGYNCAQAVLLTFADYCEIDRKQAAHLSSSFGGGMGRLREVCGAVSGMFMVLGLVYGYDISDAPDAKGRHYELIQEMARRFSERTGSIVCRELLGQEIGADRAAKPSARTEEYYRKRPCVELVGLAAELTAEYIAEHEKEIGEK